jgi:hypothetical protein
MIWIAVYQSTFAVTLLRPESEVPGSWFIGKITRRYWKRGGGKRKSRDGNPPG